MPATDIQINGRATPLSVPPQTLLLDALRDTLRLTGTHQGCDTAQCGACTVLLDGLAVKSCSVLAVQAQGHAVTTIEGLAGLSTKGGGTLHAVQEAFIACHGLQCGFCTPGMIMAATALLNENASPSEAEIVDALEGNICRCTGYVNIVAAVQQAARALAKGAA